MPVVDTPCSNCKHYIELRDPQPGCTWNRCSHPDKRLETDYPCPLNSYGYATKCCEDYSQKTIPTPNTTIVKEEAIKFFDNVCKGVIKFGRKILK